GNGQTAERRYQAKIEVGKVDRDKDIRTRLARRVHQAAEHRIRSRKDADRLGQSRDRDPFEIADEPPSGAAQPIRAQPEDLSGGYSSRNLRRERPGIDIAGGFAAGEHDSYAAMLSFRVPRSAFWVRVHVQRSAFGSAFNLRSFSFRLRLAVRRGLRERCAEHRTEPGTGHEPRTQNREPRTTGSWATGSLYCGLSNSFGSMGVLIRTSVSVRSRILRPLRRTSALNAT